MEPILVGGKWREAEAVRAFRVTNPATREELEREYPVSSWSDCEDALEAAAAAARVLADVPGAQIAEFLSAYAAMIEGRAEEIVAAANAETALPVEPRLKTIELPRTTTQLRQAAAAAAEGSWRQAVIDTKLNIRSYFAAIGPVVVFGPNNFPFAFNGVSGGDFAAAIAAGCPVIAKGHPLHARTTQLLAECAFEAVHKAGLPAATVQMIYHLENADGLRLVADSRVGTTGFTGSRPGGLALKESADKAGRLIYLEMSSLNPLVMLPGALAERGDALAVETADSGLAAAGQFCTSPNLLFVIASKEADQYVSQVASLYESRGSGTLLSSGGLDGLQQSVSRLVDAGAEVLTGAAPHTDAKGFCFRNTVLRVSGRAFLDSPEELQREAFGNATMVVQCANAEELLRALRCLEGNLTACIYSHTSGADDALYALTAGILRLKCGRLLNDKMPTGVALSAAMNHGGPFPSTAHPGFTAVGIPRSIQRFGALQCFDGVRQDRLPLALRDEAPDSKMWRVVDGVPVRG